MKNKIILISIVMGFLYGCGGSENKQNNDNPENKNQDWVIVKTSEVILTGLSEDTRLKSLTMQKDNRLETYLQIIKDDDILNYTIQLKIKSSSESKVSGRIKLSESMTPRALKLLAEHKPNQIQSYSVDFATILEFEDDRKYFHFYRCRASKYWQEAFDFVNSETPKSMFLLIPEILVSAIGENTKGLLYFTANPEENILTGLKASDETYKAVDEVTYIPDTFAKYKLDNKKAGEFIWPDDFREMCEEIYQKEFNYYPPYESDLYLPDFSPEKDEKISRYFDKKMGSRLYALNFPQHDLIEPHISLTLSDVKYYRERFPFDPSPIMKEILNNYSNKKD